MREHIENITIAVVVIGIFLLGFGAGMLTAWLQ